jgi:MFS family permease
MTQIESSQERQPLVIALAGAISLAVAMGIGRFAFTPLMPMMLHDGLIDIEGASWLASANYLGYLVGALLCSFQPALWTRWSLPPLSISAMVKVGLSLTCVLTAAMAFDMSPTWALLRLLTGLTTAITFVYTTTWCLGRLALLNRPSVGGLVYVGPGIGIAGSGLLASLMVQLEWHSASGWIAFALLATLATLLIWSIYRDDYELQSVAGRPVSTQVAGGSMVEKSALTIAYGLAGFGYIITATFLPVMARAALPGSVWLDLFWPLLGVAVALGALLASRIPAHIDQRLLLLVCYLLQALGVVIVNWLPTLTGFAIGSVLVGLPFTAITFFVMQLGRRLHPQSAPTIIGLLSGSFALGQIIGPPVAASMLSRAPDHATGFAWAIYLAGFTLLVGAAMYGWMMRRFADN